jgi:hypothetical protein
MEASWSARGSAGALPQHAMKDPDEVGWPDARARPDQRSR